MNDVKWIKLSIEMFDNRKIRYLRKLPDGNSIVLIWVMLLTMAGKCNAGGMIFLTENIPYTTKMLADELDFEESTIALAIEALKSLGMISTDGFLSIVGWEEHQNEEALTTIREKNRIKKQQYRERQKQKQLGSSGDASCDRNDTLDETDGNADGMSTNMSTGMSTDMSTDMSSDMSEDMSTNPSISYSISSSISNVVKEVGVQGEEEKQKQKLRDKPQERDRHSIPPTVEEVDAYCKLRNNGIDAEEFYDFYQSKGWMVGKDRMKDWEAAVRTWEKKRGSKGNGARKNKRDGPDGSYRQGTEHNTDFSRIKPSFDPDDYPDDG